MGLITNIDKNQPRRWVEVDNIKYEFTPSVIPYTKTYNIGDEVNITVGHDGKISYIRADAKATDKKELPVVKPNYTKEQYSEHKKAITPYEPKNFDSSYAKDITIAGMQSGMIRNIDEAFRIWHEQTIEHIKRLRALDDGD